jgi:hypothetical protein
VELQLPPALGGPAKAHADDQEPRAPISGRPIPGCRIPDIVCGRPMNYSRTLDASDGARYRYTRVGGLLLCLDQNPLRLFHLLQTRGRPFRLARQVVNRRPLRVFFECVKLLNIARLVAVLALIKYSAPVWQRNVISFSQFGHVGLKLRIGGYKLFDLERERVITRFSPDLSDAVVACQIKRAREAATCSFAPAVGNISIADRSYTEHYHNGHPLAIVRMSLERKFSDHVIPVIAEIILAREPALVTVQPYVQSLREEIANGASSLRGTLRGSARNEEELERILGFVSEQCGVLMASGWRSVALSLSHGDLHGGNILLTRDGPTVIDWNNLGTKSILYDLHMGLFRAARPVKRLQPAYSSDAASVAMFGRQIEAMAHTLVRRLELRCPSAALTLDPFELTGPIYRRLFYVEWVAKAIEKFSEDTSAPGLQRRFEHTVRWIENFSGLEEALSPRPKAESPA